MTQDRNYLRMLSDSELVRTALDRNHELAVVLAERLAELLNVEAELADAKAEIEDLDKHWTRSRIRGYLHPDNEMTALLAGAALFLLTLLLED
jgi:hypothetical protein